MPELPEVEVVRMQLDRSLVGKRIHAVDILDLKSVGYDKLAGEKMQNLTIQGVFRKGKLLYFSTDQKDIWLLAHLKMTGQLIFVSPDREMSGGGHTLSPQDMQLPHRHTRLIIRFRDGSVLYFNDMRKFGYVKVVETGNKDEELQKYGIEPISESFTFPYFQSVFAKRKTTVKALLLGQKHIAGLGNIYVDEACFRARVRPDRVASSLNSQEMNDLFCACKDVLQESIAAGGTTFYSFTQADGGSGGFSSSLRVFQREGKKCVRCSEIIQKTKLAGRGTHFCPRCQK